MVWAAQVARRWVLPHIVREVIVPYDELPRNEEDVQERMTQANSAHHVLREVASQTPAKWAPTVLALVEPLKVEAFMNTLPRRRLAGSATPRSKGRG